MTHQLIGCCRGEYEPIALRVHANTKIRLQDINESSQIGWTEVTANMKRGETRIGNDELALVITIELRHDVGKRVAVEDQHLVLPGELAGDAVFRKSRELHAAAAGECCLARAQMDHRRRDSGLWCFQYLWRTDHHLAFIDDDLDGALESTYVKLRSPGAHGRFASGDYKWSRDVMSDREARFATNQFDLAHLRRQCDPNFGVCVEVDRRLVFKHDLLEAADAGPKGLCTAKLVRDPKAGDGDENTCG